MKEEGDQWTGSGPRGAQALMVQKGCMLEHTDKSPVLPLGKGMGVHALALAPAPSLALAPSLDPLICFFSKTWDNQK